MKKKQTIKKSVRYPVSTLFFLVGIVLLSLYLVVSSITWQNNQLKTEVLSQAILHQHITNTAKTPTSISWGEHSASIKTEYYHDGIWTVSESSASFLDTSARPEQNGNIIIYGHNKPSIFKPLHSLTIGETLELTTADNTTYPYIISEITIVQPDAIEKIQPTTEEILTLYTCTGWLDSKRLVIQATPVTF